MSLKDLQKKIIEVMTISTLSIVFIFFLFRITIGNPGNLKKIDSDLTSVSKSIDTVKTFQIYLISKTIGLTNQNNIMSDQIENMEKTVKNTNWELYKLKKQLKQSQKQ